MAARPRHRRSPASARASVEPLELEAFARVTRIAADGEIYVQAVGRAGEVFRAAWLDRVRAGNLAAPKDGDLVLIDFSCSESELPIIVGVVRDRLAPAPSEAASGSAKRDRYVVDAEQEIVLRCGSASIMLRKDGRVVIKGVDILTRARRSNKLKGATIDLN